MPTGGWFQIREIIRLSCIFFLSPSLFSFSTNSSAFRYLGVMGPGLLEERVISLFVCLYFVRGINELVRDSV